MNAPGTGVVAFGATAGLVPRMDWVWGIALGAALALFLCILLWGWIGRRRQLLEVRRLVQAIEEIRSGRGHVPVDITPRSPLSLAADALNRLGEEVRVRLQEAQALGDRRRAVADIAGESPVVGVDSDGEIRSFSVGAAALFGWNESEVVGRPLAVLFEERAYRDFLPKLSRRGLPERGILTRAALVRRDGTTFSADLTVRQLAGEDRQPGGWVMLVRDATTQARLEHELEGERHRFRSLIDGLTEGLAIVQRGRIVLANRAFASQLGAPERELLGKPLRESVATGDVLLVEDRIAALEAAGSGRFELRAGLVDGNGAGVAEAHIRASAIEFEGRPASLLLVRDETLERRAEAELRLNELRLDAVLEAAADGILVLAGAGGSARVRMTNRGFGRLLGLDERALLGLDEQGLQSVLRQGGEIAAALAEFIASSASGPSAAALRSQGKPLRELEAVLTPLADPSGRALGRLIVCRDLSERRRAEAELEQFAERLQLSKSELEQASVQLERLNRELQQRADELERLNSELRTLNEMKTNLLGNVSHELQTPLVSVRGYTEMIVKERLGPINEEQRKGLELSLKNIDRLIALIDNLLLFSRQEADLGALHPTRFALRALVDEAAGLLEQQRAAREVSLRVEIADDLEVLADRDKTLQVVVNLLSNATKYNKRQGRIAVTATVGGHDRVMVRVEDTGVGIPDDQRERIFDRHYRVERPGGEGAAGSGIGLAIVRDILRLHGCRIYVESELGEGSTFSFELPVAPT